MSIQRCCPPARIFKCDTSDAAAILKAVADPYRLTILGTLARAKEAVCVCDFTDAMPLNQPTVSHHLRILKDAGLVECVRRGTWVYYRLASGARRCLDAAIEFALPLKVTT
ncbi:MAG: transcriptional regulator [Candidatus Meridianibacter frigidus]|nr:MAG: transcriptional regulator [Candidatus Eremiobacteraeota bacterium]